LELAISSRPDLPQPRNIKPVLKSNIFIEPRPGGGFGAKHEGGRRSVVVAPTQREVIAQTKAKYPDADLHVARVREIGSGPAKFRKV
jgi:hypothetical protein